MMLKNESGSNNFAEFRQSPITKKWVLINPGRAKRPEEYDQSEKKRESTQDPKDCPFCRGNEERFAPESVLEIQDKENKSWRVRVIPNKYPVVLADGLDACTIEKIDGFHSCQPAKGYHEVIITHDHEKPTPKMPVELVDDMLHSYQLRIQEIAKNKDIAYVLIFQNQGDEAGASVTHPHSQLIALQKVPADLACKLENMHRYHQERGESLMSDLFKQEKELGLRIIIESKNFIVYAPYASRFAFEAWLLPKKHASSFEEMNSGLRKECAKVLQDYMETLDEKLGEPSYNYYLHTLPVNGKYAENHESFHWHFTIFPRLNIWAGFEYGSGITVNEMSPEKAAAFLRS